MTERLSNVTTCACFQSRRKNPRKNYFQTLPLAETVGLSLHEPDKGLDELDKRLLTFVDHLGARRGGLGLGGRQDAASWGRRRPPAEVARQAGQKGALEAQEPVRTIKLKLISI